MLIFLSDVSGEPACLLPVMAWVKVACSVFGRVFGLWGATECSAMDMVLALSSCAFVQRALIFCFLSSS